MNTKYLLLLVAFLTMLTVNAQDLKYFNMKKVGSRIFIQPKEVLIKDIRQDSIKLKPIYLQDQKKLISDIKALMRKKLSSMTDEDYAVLKYTSWTIEVWGSDNHCHISTFLYPTEALEKMANWEKQLFEMTEEIKEWDFTSYDLYYSYPDDKANSYGFFSFPLLWIRN